MDQYLTSLNEVESRLIASEKWIDVPLKKQDYSHLNLDATNEGEPAEYYRNMFDLIALAFDADITRSVAFMLNREDGMGISDTFPLKLGLGNTHHKLSHADRQGRPARVREVRPVPQPAGGALPRPAERSTRTATARVLDNTIVLFGSGASTTHNPKNLPTLVAGGAKMGLKHGTYWRKDDARMSNMYLSILRSHGHRAGVVRRQHRHAERLDFSPARELLRPVDRFHTPLGILPAHHPHTARQSLRRGQDEVQLLRLGGVADLGVRRLHLLRQLNQRGLRGGRVGLRGRRGVLLGRGVLPGRGPGQRPPLAHQALLGGHRGQHR